MKKRKQNSISFFWKEIIFSWEDLNNLIKGNRRYIVTPASNHELSAAENYLLQFETKIAFTGDILMKIPPYEAYPNKEKWEEQLTLHQKKVNEYVQSQFALLDHIHTIIDRIILAIGFFKSGHDLYVVVIKTIEKNIEHQDWKPWIWNAILWGAYFLFRKLKKPIMKAVIQFLKKLVWNKTKIEKQIARIFGKLGFTKSSNNKPFVPVS